MGSPSTPERICLAFSRQSSTSEAVQQSLSVPPAHVVELRPPSDELLQVAHVLLDGGLRLVLLPIEHHEGSDLVAAEQQTLRPSRKATLLGAWAGISITSRYAAAQVDLVPFADHLDGVVQRISQYLALLG